MSRKFQRNIEKVLIAFWVSIFIFSNVSCLDCGEWIVEGSGIAKAGNVQRWRAVRESSEAYKIKSGITPGIKPDGNIVVAVIRKRLSPFDEERVVIRSSMYPFGQINRAYDSIDLADILLGNVHSKNLKTMVFLYNKLCALEMALSSVAKAGQGKKEEKIQAVLKIKQDLILYSAKLAENVDQSLVDDITALSPERLQVPSLGRKIKLLRTSIMPLLKSYITNLISYFSGIHRIIGNSITLRKGIDNVDIPISIVAQERISEVLTMCEDEKTYDKVNVELKKMARFEDNAHRLVHSEDILLYYISQKFLDYRPTLLCTYLNMCQDCEHVVSMFANVGNGGEALIVVSEREIPGEEGVRRNSENSLVKKILIPRL